MKKRKIDKSQDAATLHRRDKLSGKEKTVADEKLTPEELQRHLAQFIGTTAYHRTGLRSVATDGALYLAENAGAFWLLTLVDSVMPAIGEAFAVVNLTVDLQAQKGTIIVHNGHDPDEEDSQYRVFHRQELDYTDFPLAEIRLFVQGGVILLPSEY